MTETTNQPARDRLIASGARLFAQKGYGGASVREICDDAETTMNMIHHYFGNKEGLFREVVGQLNEDVFVVPLQLLDRPVTSQDDLQSRFALIFETTLKAYIKNRDALVVAVREQAEIPALGAYMDRLVAFMDDAKERGIIRAEVESSLITGAMLDRILNQVHFAPFIKRTFDIDVLADREYQERWSNANIDLFLHGLLADANEQAAH